MGTLPEEDIDNTKRSVLGRAFDILDCFLSDGPDQTIVGLCTRTGLPPATVHRMLAGLVEWGAVERHGRGHYRLGRRIWRLGREVPGVRHLRDVARPFMVDLYSTVGELVVLGSREDPGVDLTDFVGGRSVTGDWGSCGRVSLLDSAPGLVYLAHSSPEECDADLAACRPPEWTRADEFRLRQRLGEVRRTGVAVLPGDAPGDPVWVSAPVFDHGGTVRTTLSVVAPAYRLNVPGVSHAVNGAAHAMTQALHGQARPAARTVTYPKPGVRTA